MKIAQRQICKKARHDEQFQTIAYYIIYDTNILYHFSTDLPRPRVQSRLSLIGAAPGAHTSPIVLRSAQVPSMARLTIKISFVIKIYI